MKLRVYLDTSVFSAYYDQRHPDRKAETEQFWKKLNQFEASTSDITKLELSQTPNAEMRSKFLALLKQVGMVPVTQNMKDLARNYLEADIFTPTMLNDAIHVAAAVMTRQDVLLSWNFKHLVNRRRRGMVNQVNISKGLPTIEIVAPPEI
jgi:predicted nucleic acid-binding protein